MLWCLGRVGYRGLLGPCPEADDSNLARMACFHHLVYPVVKHGGGDGLEGGRRVPPRGGASGCFGDRPLRPVPLASLLPASDGGRMLADLGDQGGVQQHPVTGHRYPSPEYPEPHNHLLPHHPGHAGGVGHCPAGAILCHVLAVRLLLVSGGWPQPPLVTEPMPDWEQLLAEHMPASLYYTVCQASVYHRPGLLVCTGPHQ